jgi:uncharacterized protein YukE
VRKSLDTLHLLAINAPCTVRSLAGVLLTMASTYRMPENVAKALGYVAEAMQHTEQQRQNGEDNKSLPELLKCLQDNLSAEMDSKLNALEKKLTIPPPEQEQLKSAAKEIGQAAESLKASISDIGNSIAQVTDTSTQLASTATNYKDTLIKSSKQTHFPDQISPAQMDPKILKDVDRKACQILIDTLDPRIQGASHAEIKEKVSAAIKRSLTRHHPRRSPSWKSANSAKQTSRSYSKRKRQSHGYKIQA